MAGRAAAHRAGIGVCVVCNEKQSVGYFCELCVWNGQTWESHPEDKPLRWNSRRRIRGGWMNRAIEPTWKDSPKPDGFDELRPGAFALTKHGGHDGSVRMLKVHERRRVIEAFGNLLAGVQ